MTKLADLFELTALAAEQAVLIAKIKAIGGQANFTVTNAIQGSSGPFQVATVDFSGLTMDVGVALAKALRAKLNTICKRMVELGVEDAIT